MRTIQFEKHWLNFSSTIKSLLIRQLKQSRPNIPLINQEIETYKKRWNSDSTIEGAWYNQLNGEAPEIASKFTQLINSIELKPLPYKKPSIIGCYLLITLIGIAGFMTAVYYDLTWWRQILIFIISIIMAITFILPIGQRKIMEYNEKIISDYLRQLSDIKSQITVILSE